jgi:hypothetical protein
MRVHATTRLTRHRFGFQDGVNSPPYNPLDDLLEFTTHLSPNILHNFDIHTPTTTRTTSHLMFSPTTMRRHVSNRESNQETNETNAHTYPPSIPISPISNLMYLALDVFSSTDNIFDDYEANLRLAESIGVVEVGIDNIDDVSTLTPKNRCNDEICTICLEKMSDKVDEKARQLICGHIYCDTCISQWLSKSKKCPVCNVDLEDKLQDFLAS